jgi:hypothetical protein
MMSMCSQSAAASAARAASAEKSAANRLGAISGAGSGAGEGTLSDGSVTEPVYEGQQAFDDRTFAASPAAGHD